MRWLAYEVQGYTLDASGNFSTESWDAALRSNRPYWSAAAAEGQGAWNASPVSVGQAQTWIESARVALNAATDAPSSVASANPSQMVFAGAGNSKERRELLQGIERYSTVIEHVTGAVHSYVSSIYQELRFGNAIESAFATVRASVDERIASLVPDGLPKLSAALESASSSNPEHWASAAAGCRRLIVAAADALQPPGPPIDGRPMTERYYINRLVHWIEAHQLSGTARDVTTAELAHFGERIDAASDAGNKGAHAEVTRYEAARYITGTYLLLGDILSLYHPPHAEETASVTNAAEFSAGSAPAETD